MPKLNPLVKKYGKEKRWCNYRIETANGKRTKVPYAINGRKASSTDEKSWATYEEAVKKSEQVGIIFTPAKTLLGIDIDHCLTGKKITHEERETIAELILEADTYTEISPSGEGLHLLLSLEEALTLVSNKKAPYEVYTAGRYFTVTLKEYGASKPVRTVSIEEAQRLLKIIGYPFKDDNKNIQKPSKENGNKEKDLQDTTSSVLSDEDIITKMCKSKDAKALYEGDITKYEGDHSKADMAFLSHLAFWTRKDAAQMERIWLASPIGQRIAIKNPKLRTKTQSRPDYRLRSINAAIGFCQKVYETPKIKMEEQNPGMDLLYRVIEKGQIQYIQNTENICRILRKHPKFAGRFRYDEFKNVFEMKEGEAWRTIEDNDSVIVQTDISILFSDWFGGVGKLMVYDAIIKVCKENKIDSAKDYITSLVWDGEARLGTWLSSVYGVNKDAYHAAVASNWVKGLVKRIMEPGCKFDYVLVLEGEQGSKKSTSLAILGGDWHVESAMSTESKDFFMQFQGKAIIEFSEGETLSRTEVKRMKAIITMQTDRFRVPYERTTQDFPRRCVFAMTTNQDEYLKDETGNRRWLPVKVMFAEANIEWLIENRDQIFAEAYHRLIVLKETTYDFPIEETMKQQQMRRISDPNEDVITEWYFGLDYERQKLGVSVHTVFKEALRGGFSGKSMNKYEEMSIATVLKDHLKLVKKQRTVSGVRMSLWCNATGAPMGGDAVMDAVEEAKNNF